MIVLALRRNIVANARDEMRHRRIRDAKTCIMPNVNRKVAMRQNTQEKGDFLQWFGQTSNDTATELATQKPMLTRNKSARQQTRSKKQVFEEDEYEGMHDDTVGCTIQPAHRASQRCRRV
jgi:hypothetical protein